MLSSFSSIFLFVNFIGCPIYSLHTNKNIPKQDDNKQQGHLASTLLNYRNSMEIDLTRQRQDTLLCVQHMGKPNS